MSAKTTNPNQTHTADHKPEAAKPVAPPQAAELTQLASLETLQYAVVAPGLARPADILALQRTVGNRAVQRLIQTKLTVGPAGDQYEQEADRVAQQVMTMPTPGQTQPTVQRAGPEEEEEIQTKPLAASITPLVQRAASPPEVQRASSGAGFEVGGEFEQQLAASQGGGSPLPAEVRSFMEPRFGADFSGVQVHTGSEAVQMNREVSAQAFTSGQDIYLGKGKTDLTSTPGKELLAHELTHVVQQTEPSDLAAQRAPEEEGSQTKPMIQRVSLDTAEGVEDDLVIQRVEGEEKPAKLHIHTDLEAPSLGLTELLEGDVGHSWVSLEWKNPAVVPVDIQAAHQPFLRRGGMFADPMGFWPKMFHDYDSLLDKWENLPDDQRVGYSSNPFASYVAGQMLHPDNIHTPKATQTYDVTRGEADSVINYAESKRDAQYSVYFYNCTTFAKEAVESAGKKPPDSSTLGICYPNALYEGIVKNQTKGIGTTEVHADGGPVNRVEGREEEPKKK